LDSETFGHAGNLEPLRRESVRSSFGDGAAARFPLDNGGSGMIRKYAIALVAFLALTGSAFADKFDVQVNINKADFDATRTHLIGQMESDKYSDITPADKASVIAALDRIDVRLGKSQLGDQDRLDIFNDQELINQITSHARAESRLFCEREEPTGSHVIRVVCMSMGKWMEREKAGQTAMRAIEDNHRNSCPGCP
jgi:hypothetical protein